MHKKWELRILIQAIIWNAIIAISQTELYIYHHSGGHNTKKWFQSSSSFIDLDVGWPSYKS